MITDNDPTPLDVGGKVQLLDEYLRRYPRQFVVETGIYLGWGSTMRLSNIEDIPYLILVDYQDVNCQEAFEWLRVRRKAAHYLDVMWQHWEPLGNWDTLVIRGRSEDAMPRLMPLINEPALLWLDAHEPGTDCPLWAELTCVMGSPHVADHVVLIDDARLFGDGPWPPLDEVIERCALYWDVSLRQDVIRCTPRAASV